MKFEMTDIYFENSEPVFFNENDAPAWLKGNGTGSTVDNRWFWNDHVLNLKMGSHIKTDFRSIKRIE
jgi:hypothetical protein